MTLCAVAVGVTAGYVTLMNEAAKLAEWIYIHVLGYDWGQAAAQALPTAAACMALAAVGAVALYLRWDEAQKYADAQRRRAKRVHQQPKNTVKPTSRKRAG